MRLLDIILSAYPQGLRNDTADPIVRDNYEGNSITFYYDTIRATIADNLSEKIKRSASDQNVLTADFSGVEEWENFLTVVPESSDLLSRRSLLFSRMNGISATKATVLATITDMIGGDGSNVSLYERYNEVTPTELDLWTYEVRITLPTSKTFVFSDLYNRLLAVQPAHVNLIIVLDNVPEGYWAADDAVTGPIWGGEIPDFTDFQWS